MTAEIIEYESPVSARIRARAASVDCFLMRNNSGVMMRGPCRAPHCPVTGDRVPVRFGLGNDSAKINRARKTADLIGYTCTGRFIAVEVKRPGWRYTGKGREPAQLAFLEHVLRFGGIGCFATSWDDVLWWLTLYGDIPDRESGGSRHN